MIFKRIEEKCEEQNVNIKELLPRIPLSANGYYAAKRNNDIKISTLKKIADLLDTPIEYFLGVNSIQMSMAAEPGGQYQSTAKLLDQINKTVLENNTMLRQITGKEPIATKKTK